MIGAIVPEAQGIPATGTPEIRGIQGQANIIFFSLENDFFFFFFSWFLSTVCNYFIVLETDDTNMTAAEMAGTLEIDKYAGGGGG